MAIVSWVCEERCHGTVVLHSIICACQGHFLSQFTYADRSFVCWSFALQTMLCAPTNLKLQSEVDVSSRLRALRVHA